MSDCQITSVECRTGGGGGGGSKAGRTFCEGEERKQDVVVRHGLGDLAAAREADDEDEVQGEGGVEGTGVRLYPVLHAVVQHEQEGDAASARFTAIKSYE